MTDTPVPYPPPDAAPPAMWTPWRLQYLTGLRTPAAAHECFLCSAGAAPELDRDTHVVLRRRTCFAILNLYPYSNGHIMVTPYGHLGSMAEMGDGLLLELMHLSRDVQAVLAEVMRPDGFNVGINVGRVAGAGLPGHLHIHVVPRWNGDANFMTVVGGVRLIPEELGRTRDRLAEAAARLGLDGMDGIPGPLTAAVPAVTAVTGSPASPSITTPSSPASHVATAADSGRPAGTMRNPFAGTAPAKARLPDAEQPGHHAGGGSVAGSVFGSAGGTGGGTDGP